MTTLPFSDEEYGKILDHIVVACVDTAITHKGKILLVKRTEDPAKDSWWIFGGRIQRGETLQQAARRGIYRELALDISDEERFSEFGVFNLIWPVRREPVATHGSHHLLVAHSIELTDDEYQKITTFISVKPEYCWKDIKTRDEDMLPELQAILLRLQPASKRGIFAGIPKLRVR
jgi:colanic acid biosynthesis protein WcaH